MRDPDAPPPPTLLGQVKEIKDVKGKADAQASYIAILENKIELLERKQHRLESQVEQIISAINRRK